MVVPAFLMAVFLTGCGVKRMLPSTAVLRGDALTAFDTPRTAGVDYTTDAVVDHPVLPIQIFGIHYAVDVVLSTRHPDWDMHEFARLDTPAGPLWMAKDSDHAGVQTVYADIEDIEAWAPEVPVPRNSGEMVVDDRSQGRVIDLSLAYTNPAGEPVTVEVRAKMPRNPPKKRNGSTMGHSRQAAAVVLDLERFGSGGRAHVTINGERQRIRRMLGLVRLQFLLQQSQGGVAISDYVQRPEETNAFLLERPGAASQWNTHAEETWTQHEAGDFVVLSHDNGYTKISYGLLDGGISWGRAEQHGRDQPVFEIHFDPALPDMARPFEGTVSSSFRMDINGQQGHGTGTMTAWWSDHQTVEFDFTPLSPWWVADRPMSGRILHDDQGQTWVSVVRDP